MFMAGLDPAIQSQNSRRWNLLSWIAAHVLGLDPGIEGGHDNKGIPYNFDIRFSAWRRP
jgi:hypothetical protein